MIYAMFGGLIIIVTFILIAYAFSLAITFWFISIPLFFLWLWWLAKSGQKRIDNRTPYEIALHERDMALLHRHDDLYRGKKR
jgi:Flp pilus assembly protein TadB